jgi:hypothetical protein
MMDISISSGGSQVTPSASPLHFSQELGLRRVHAVLQHSVVVAVTMAIVACTAHSERRSAAAAPGAVMIDSSDAVRVGTDSATLFQVSSGHFVGDSILLAERSTSTLRLYASDGHLIRAVGAHGSGPGEFAFLLWDQVDQDFIYAYDAALRRLSLFDRRLSFVRTVPIRIPERFGSGYAIGVFADHSLLLGARQKRATVRQPSVVRTRLLLLRADSTVAHVDSLGVVWDQELFVTPFGRHGESSSPLVFGRQGSIAVGPAAYFVLEDDSAVIARHQPTGGVSALWRPTTDPSPGKISSADVKIARQRFVQHETPAVPLAPIFDAMPVPKAFPPFGWSGEYPIRALRVHGDSTVWVLHFGGVADLAPTWTVFSLDGHIRGRVKGAVEMDVLDSRGDRVLVLRHGEAGEEIVEVRHLTNQVH